MSNVDFVIDTNQVFSSLHENRNSDPNHHLPAAEWVQKQIEYTATSSPSGEGLIEAINSLKGELVGVEVGVCLAHTTEAFAKGIKNLKKLYAVDNYPTFVDWDGSDWNKDRQDLMKKAAQEKMLAHKDKVEFLHVSSEEFVKTIEDESLDFVFIDGDHSYEAALKDFQNYYPKVKKGGVFGGHDIQLYSVRDALTYFLKEKFHEVIESTNSSWYLRK
jgi:predicted O-methyltransferase YrrM